MGKKTIVGAFVLLLVILFVAGLTALSRRSSGTEESSAEESAVVTSQIIVPSEMPSRIALTPPAGFEETSSDYFEKYYIKDDASIIITGEEIRISGAYLADYAADVKAQYEQTADDFHIDSERTVQVNGVDCWELEFGYAIRSADARQNMRCLTAVLLKDDYAYIITCKSRQENFGAYYAGFCKAVESIVIADASASETALPADASIFTGAVS